MSGMTFGQQSSRLVAQIRGMSHDSARMAINQAYVACCEDHSWFHLLHRFTLRTEAQYNTGTVSVTNGSTAVALTGGTWVNTWTTAPSMRRMTISGSNEPYDVSSIANPNATLADAWIGTTNATANYSMFRDTYALPSDCDMHKVVALFDPSQQGAPTLNGRLYFYNPIKFLAERSIAPWLVTIPWCFTVVEQTTEAPPRPQIQLFPAPADVRTYHGWYFRRPSFLTSDAAYLDWPPAFDDMIWTRALVDHYSMPSNYSPKYLAEWKPRYQDLYRKMKSQMDGQSAIDFEIEQARMGRWFGQGSAWSPDPTGLSGTGFFGSGWSR